MTSQRPAPDSPDEDRFDALLEGAAGASVDADLRALKNLLDSASAPSSPAEQTAGLAAALRAHGEATSRRRAAAAPAKSARRRWGLGTAAALVVLGSSATAAYAGVLPAPLQDLAHATIGAPAADSTSPSTPDPASDRVGGPGATPGQQTGPGATLAPAPETTFPPGNANGLTKPKNTPAPNGNANGVGKPKPTPAPNGNANGLTKPKPTPAPRGNSGGNR